jgi:nucleoside-diphosphate-sugar epimerase
MKGFSRVVVTGGVGFIGSRLVRELLGRGCYVVVLDNFCSGSWENLRGLHGRDGFEVVEGDVRDRRVVRKVMKGADGVVHLAALIDVEASVRDPFQTHDVNVNGTLNVLHAAVKSGVRRFVFASSTAVYGDANPLPLKEDYPLCPISPYAASKAAAEGYCRAFNSCYGLGTVILRYFNVYGLGQRNSTYSGVITRFLEKAFRGEPLIVYGDGGQTRDFIYVDDVVKATILALEGVGVEGETFNVCTGKPTSVNELVEVVRAIVGRDLRVVYDEPRKGDIRSNYGDPSKAEKTLGFNAKTSLREGIEKMASGFCRKMGCS